MIPPLGWPNRNGHRPSCTHTGSNPPDQPAIRNGLLAGQVKKPVQAKGGGIRRDFEVCPCSRELTDKAQAVFEREDGTKGFKCFHENNCPFDTWRDLRSAYDRDYDPQATYAENGQANGQAGRIENGPGTPPARRGEPHNGQGGFPGNGQGGGPHVPGGGMPHTNGHAEGGDEDANWTYATDKKGRLVHQTSNGPKVIMYGHAWIRRAVKYGPEEEIYEIEGTSRSGGDFEFTISSDAFSDPRRLKAELKRAMGPKDYVEKGKRSYLEPAISEMTKRRNGHLQTLTGARRTGWRKGRFLIPGRVPEDVVLDFDTGQLPFHIPEKGDLEEGLARLEDLIQAIGPDRSTIVLSQVLGAPLAHLAGLRDERYALFIKGQTGSLKTSWTQAAMAIYGPQFLSDETLLRWGQGATPNALMHLAGQARDLPFFVDNYKPNVGRGERKFVEMMHQVLEGGEKKRLNRNSQLKDSQDIHAWPIFTGEDLPQSDAASLARLLAIEFLPAEGMNEALLRVQNSPEAISAVGARWLDWLETEEAREVAGVVADGVTGYQETFAQMIRERFPGCMNVMRLARNLAVNRALFEAACQAPKIGAVLSPYLDDHQAGITGVITRMGEYATASLEAHRFLVAVTDLLSTGKARLVPRREDIDHWKASDVIGYRDPVEQTVYLVPAITRKAVQFHAGEDLSNLSSRALYRQLDQISALKKTGDTQTTIRIRVGPDSQQCRCLAVHPRKLGFGDFARGSDGNSEGGGQDELPF